MLNNLRQAGRDVCDNNNYLAFTKVFKSQLIEKKRL